MNHSLKKLLVVGIAAELLIFLVSYSQFAALEDSFRYAARYSGRLSLFVFIYAFYLYAAALPKTIADNKPLGNFLKLFAVLHLIHFGFLAVSVYLNDIPLETIKVIGGALAYIMIIAAPFKLKQVGKKSQLVYFYYVSLVMILTYVARIKGDFEGAASHWFHYLGISGMLLSCIVFGWWIYRTR